MILLSEEDFGCKNWEEQKRTWCEFISRAKTQATALRLRKALCFWLGVPLIGYLMPNYWLISLLQSPGTDAEFQVPSMKVFLPLCTYSPTDVPYCVF